MGLSLESKNEALKAILDRPLMLGLLDKNGEEESDENYQRQPVQFRPARAAEKSDEWVNTHDVRFGGWATNSDLSAWVLFADDGTEVAREGFRNADEEVESRSMKRRERLIFEAGDLLVGLDG